MHIYEPRFPEFSGFLKVFVRNKRFKNIIKNSSGILVDSKVGKKHLIDYSDFNPNKIYILPFVPPDYIRKKGELKNYTTDKFNLPDKYLFYPAKFWAHKNHIGLLKAIKLSKEKCNDIHFVFTGSKQYNYKKIYYWIKKLELERTITILGEVNLKYIRFLYLKASGLFMPTFAGPTSIPPIEALMCNCPMAVSNIYGMKEQMKKASLYFNPNSVDEMSKAIIKLWNNEERKISLIKEGEKLKDNLSILSHKNRILEILDKVQNLIIPKNLLLIRN